MAVVLLLAAITAGFYWKLVLTRQYTWLDSPDLAYQVLPWLQFEAREWHQGRFPLWDPHQWGGQPLLGQGQPGAAYPLNWILFSLPLRDGRLRLGFLDWYFVATHFLAALFAYLLCRDLRRSRAASLLAGAFFGLGGWIGETRWPQMLNGAIWTPLIFLFLLRAVRGRRCWSSAALSGVFAGVAWLSGHHQIPLFVCLSAGAVWAYLVLRRGQPDIRTAGLAAVWVVFAALAGALQTLPAYEYGRLARRWVGTPEPLRWNEPVPYHVHEEYSLGATSLLGLVVPGIHKHSDAFVGVTALTLALLGLTGGWGRRRVRLFGAIALGGILLALGGESLMHGLIYAIVPLVEKARTPAMAIFIFHFGISVLIAYGADELRRRAAWVKRFAGGLAVLGAALYLICLALVIAGRLQVMVDDRLVLAGLASLLLAALLDGFRRGRIARQTVLACATAMLLFELANSGAARFSERDRSDNLNRLKQGADAAWFLRQQPGSFRVAVDDQQIPYNFGDWRGLDDMGGYVASVPDRVLRLGSLTPHREDLYGVAYRVGAPGNSAVFTGASGVSVFARPGAFPRVWTVHELTATPAEDLRRQAFLEGTLPALQRCNAEDHVRLVESRPDRVALEAEMACAGMVILSDNFFPGWRATVDGNESIIYPAYVSLRGVVVPAGKHRVEMVYRPGTVYWGAVLTLAAVVGALCLSTWERRRGRNVVLNYR